MARAAVTPRRRPRSSGLQPNNAVQKSNPAGGPGRSEPPFRRSAIHRQTPVTCIMIHMRLSARSDYALRAVIELAASGGGHVTADQLARTQSIPGKFLEAILTQLRRAGLVRSQRGPDGGFWLARPASDISLADIIRAIDGGPLVGVRGERPENLGCTTGARPSHFRRCGSRCGPTSGPSSRKSRWSTWCPAVSRLASANWPTTRKPGHLTQPERRQLIRAARSTPATPPPPHPVTAAPAPRPSRRGSRLPGGFSGPPDAGAPLPTSATPAREAPISANAISAKRRRPAPLGAGRRAEAGLGLRREPCR